MSPPLAAATAPAAVDGHRVGAPAPRPTAEILTRRLAELSGLVLASVAVRGGAADRATVVAQAVTAIAAGVEIADRHVAAGGRDVRLHLDDGTVLRVVAGTPVAPKAHPEAAFTVSAIVERHGTMPGRRLAALLGAVQRVGFTGLEIAELRAQMPLTTTLHRFLPAGCLAGVAPLLTVHHMTDFLVMVEAVRAMGVPAEAITVIDKGYRYRHTQRVDAHLRAAGIAVFAWTATADALADHAGRARAAGRKALLVDDGGYTLPVLLDTRPDLLGSFVGLVEQTISGIVKLERFGDQLPLPVFSVAESRLKATVESYGVADAAVRAVLQLLPDEKFEGQPALVVGYGRIGEQVAELLRARRMRVAVYDAAIVKLIAAHERGFLTGRSLSRLLGEHQPLLVLGTTGRASVRGEHVGALRRDCYLASTTSRTNEFALDELTAQARHVSDAGVLGTRLHLTGGLTATLLGDGFPINFHHAESLPNKYSDLVLASLLVGAATLARPDHGFSRGHNVAATDAVLESCGLLERYYRRFGPAGQP